MWPPLPPGFGISVRSNRSGATGRPACRAARPRHAGAPSTSRLPGATTGRSRPIRRASPRRSKSAIVLSLMVDGSGALDCRVDLWQVSTGQDCQETGLPYLIKAHPHPQANLPIGWAWSASEPLPLAGVNKVRRSKFSYEFFAHALSAPRFRLKSLRKHSLRPTQYVDDPSNAVSFHARRCFKWR